LNSCRPMVGVCMVLCLFATVGRELPLGASLPGPYVRPSRVRGARLQLPSRVRRDIASIAAGKSRTSVDRIFIPYDGRTRLTSGIVSGWHKPSLMGRSNPQIMFYRFAHTDGLLDRWTFSQFQRNGLGTFIAVDITWRYSESYNHKSNVTKFQGSQRIVYAPAYDGVAGGSADDVVVKISKPYIVRVDI